MTNIEIKGRVTEVGWATPKRGTSFKGHASVEIRLGRSRTQEKADEKLKLLREKLLGKRVTITISEHEDEETE